MKHVLVVDDDRMNCILVKHALSTDYRVTTVSSGEEALTVLEQEIPDLILMDIEMPKTGGKEVARCMKANAAWADIPIVFLTADADPATEAECLQLGADDFITKPFIPMVMSIRVSRILELRAFKRAMVEELEQKSRQVEAATIRSLTDALTGLYNRAYLEKRLKELLSAGCRGAVFMIDLDNFKAVNDTFGHIVGDKTLQLFAEVLKEQSGKEDIVCRLAGDEFMAFFTDMTMQEEAAEKAESMIVSFADKMKASGYPGVVSLSIGIVMAQEGENDFTSLYSKADKSLYFVKNNGKNTYHFYSEHKEKTDTINTVADLAYINRMITSGMDAGKGAFHVAYDEFKKIYDFVHRCVIRKNQKVQLVLFTLQSEENPQSGEGVDAAMAGLKESILTSLRSVDAGTRYSSSQYIVILMDTNIENGKMVAERVVGRFMEKYGNQQPAFYVSYDIQTMEPNTAEENEADKRKPS